MVTDPVCADSVIRKLSSLSRGDRDGGIWNDLAAAYYLRAQQRDTPLDIVRAFEAAQTAVATNPKLPEARFNLALAEEALGLRGEAIERWDQVRRDGDGAWAAEASHRREVLLRERALDAASSVRLLRERLVEMIRLGDREAAVSLIEHDSDEAHRFVEEQILPGWARATKHGDAEEQYDAARMMGEVVARVTGDRYLSDSVERMTSARNARDMATLDALREGHLAFADARAAEQAGKWPEAENAYRHAENAFTRADSPFRYRAMIAAVGAAFHDRSSDQDATARLGAAARFARAHRYEYLWMRAQGTRAYVLQQQGRVVEALELYAEIAASGLQTYDEATLARIRRISLLRQIGKNDLAWREAFQAIRLGFRSEGEPRDLLLGEVAATLSATGHGEVALLYQNAYIKRIEDDLSRSVPDAAVRGLRGRLSVALRGRASIEIQLGRLDQAKDDLIAANGLAGFPDDEGQLQLARISEIQGQAFLGSNPLRAVAAFTEALRLAQARVSPSYRGDLFAQRAAANMKRGDRAAAEQDLRSAIEEIRSEELLVLQGKNRSSPYLAPFARLSDVYQRMAVQLAETGHFAEAFVYAEKARLRASSDFIDEVRTAGPRVPLIEAVALNQLQAALPRNTALLEYLVLDDRTLIWVVSLEHFDFLSLPVGATTVESWVSHLRNAATQRNLDSFARGLGAPYAGLFAEPLKRLTSARREQLRTLIIVPGAAMNGLPLAALRNEATQRYLIEDFSVATAENATLYVGCLIRDRAIRAPLGSPILLMADPAFDQTSELGRGLTRMPWARTEVAEISKLYGPSAIIRSGNASTIPSLIELAPKSVVVHLAVQAIVNEQIPSQSIFLLAPLANDSGVLTYRDLFQHVRFTATKLVVLSGCSTAAVSESGVVPATAFLAAGVPAVVGSHWAVGDADTADFMVAFHRQYREGLDVVSALSTVQLSCLRDKNLSRRSPLSWAAWQVMGAASSRLDSSDSVHAAVAASR